MKVNADKHICVSSVENKYGWEIDKLCCSCKHCIADAKGVGLFSNIRMCSITKEAINRFDMACEQWVMKKGLEKAGLALGHDVRKIDRKKILEDMERKMQEWRNKHPLCSKQTSNIE